MQDTIGLALVILIGCAACSSPPAALTPQSPAESAQRDTAAADSASDSLDSGVWQLRGIKVVGDDFTVEQSLVGGSGTLSIAEDEATIVMAGASLSADYSGAANGATLTTLDGRLHGDLRFASTRESVEWTADSTSQPFQIATDGQPLAEDELGGFSLPSTMSVTREGDTMRWTYVEGDPWTVTMKWIWER
ncbi:hypothetical protein ACEXQD_09375 [Herbiconiux sp. P15]|uniref:hypothetical protein n=1 Tax=Herbiconiux liukaitaii TaxID=3342799 RepID=UPI0035B985D6